MNEIIEPSRKATLPLPRAPISIRVATMEDLPFIDALQKAHTKMVGWMPTQQLEGKIRLGHVILAEEELTADFADNADKKELDLNSSAPSALSAVQSVGKMKRSRSPIQVSLLHLMSPFQMTASLLDHHVARQLSLLAQRLRTQENRYPARPTSRGHRPAL